LHSLEVIREVFGGDKPFIGISLSMPKQAG
jgi:hypothetical protein